MDLTTNAAATIMASMLWTLPSPAALSLPVASSSRAVPTRRPVVRVTSDVNATMFKLFTRIDISSIIRLNVA